MTDGYAVYPLPKKAQEAIPTICTHEMSPQEAVDAIRAWMNVNGIAYQEFDYSCVKPFIPK